MKVVRATFEFRGWTCLWKRGRVKILQERRYRTWNIFITHNGDNVGVHQYIAFTPSACICRKLIKKHYKNTRKGWNKKNKGLTMKGNKITHL